MSHFSTIAVQIKEGELLRDVLEELGYTVEEKANVRGYLWNRTPADYVIRQANGFDLGFRRRGETYELVADFWGSKLDQQSFLNQVMQAYAHKKLLATAQQQGYTIETQETLADGSIRVVVGRWV